MTKRTMKDMRKTANREIKHIFVYGTLMQGFPNHELFLAGQYLERRPGYIKGRLYHLNYGFPAITDGNGEVKGEIYLVKNMEKLLPALDYLEDYNQPGQEDLYKREKRETRDAKGNIILCYVYIWPRDRLAELDKIGTHIAHGDWAKFMEESQNATG